MAAHRDLETMLVGKVLTIDTDRFLYLFIPHIANALEEEQGQDITLPVCAVYRATT